MVKQPGGKEQPSSPKKFDDFQEFSENQFTSSYPREINPSYEDPAFLTVSSDGVRRSVYRQDYQIYRFNFASCCQAIALILAVLMLINSLLYLSFQLQAAPRPDWPYVLSWIFFAESGGLLLFSGLAIPKFTITVKKFRLSKNFNPHISQLQFAFVHSLTYFISGLLMVGLSFIAYNALT
ncbi:MAG: hypothetical protein K9W42_09205 [Candidatus Heimdallarchaeota archaeon]|nr:hypothetical protein [Candidatus Heimdallarchaeota archaeon]